jgi:hypothetical protein
VNEDDVALVVDFIRSRQGIKEVSFTEQVQSGAPLKLDGRLELGVGRSLPFSMVLTPGEIQDLVAYVRWLDTVGLP